MSIDDVIELCNQLSDTYLCILRIFCSNGFNSVEYKNIEEYRKAVSMHYINAREEYTSCIVMKGGYIHVHIKIYYGEKHTYIGKNILHDTELIVFCDSGCVFPSTVSDYENIINNIEEYLAIKCYP